MAEATEPMLVVALYHLSDPRTGEVHYIGVTRRRPSVRLRAHISQARKSRSEKDRWVVGLLDAGLEPVMTVFARVDEANWEQAERFWIAEFRRRGFPLLNGSEGGEGALGLTTEAYARLVANNAQRGKPGHMRGVPRTEESKVRQAAAQRGKKRSPEQKERMAEAARRREAARREAGGMSEETRAKIAESQRARWAKAKADGYQRTDETKARISKSQKASWAKRKAGEG